MTDRNRAGGSPRISRRAALTGGAAVAVGGLFWLSAPPSTAQNAGTAPLEIEVTPVGVPAGELNAIIRGLQDGSATQRSPALRAAQPSPNIRVLRIRAEDPPKPASGNRSMPAQERWSAVAYDYGRQRTLLLEGRLGDSAPDRVRTQNYQPVPSIEEWRDARDLLRRHPYFGPLLRSGDFIAYRPMPPVAGGRGRRLITVGVLPRIDGDRALRRLLPLGGDAAPHEIVAVDLASGEVRRFAARAPARSRATAEPTCGAPVAADQPTSSVSDTGQYLVRIKRAGKVIWEFTAVRPSASSGMNGSGVQLNNVRYKGQSVLHRAHVPILNVSYEDDICGPYRDWQWQESMLEADGADVAPGFRKTTSAPRTIIQSGDDSGNFLGTAIWVDGEEVTLMAELEAGWYRYVSQWTFHTNGTIKPRWGFAGVADNCICNTHYHHAYWRFDFDIGDTPDDNYVEELRDGKWQSVPTERKAHRDAALERRWRVGSRGAKAKYEIRPGHHDGRAKNMPDWPYPRGDLWFLRFENGQIDDGVPDQDGSGTEADIDKFVTGASLQRADIVVWYAAHFAHSETVAGAHGRHGPGHVLGPNLVPVSWGDPTPV